MKNDNNNRQTMKKMHNYVRRVIQLIFFIFFTSIFTAAFSGIKEIFTKIGSGDLVELSGFVMTLIVVCAFTVVFGRFFCGFACAFGSFGDFCHGTYLFICRKLKKKPYKAAFLEHKALSWVKYIVLLLIVAGTFTGVYSKITGAGLSPWEVFSMLTVFKFRFSDYIPGIIILLLIMGGMTLSERFFCRVLCPMGAVFSLLPILPGFAVRRDRSKCIKGCSACLNNCPMNVELPDSKSDGTGDCIMCGKCEDICPVNNPKGKFIKTNDVRFTILRAILLVVILLLYKYVV